MVKLLMCGLCDDENLIVSRVLAVFGLGWVARCLQDLGATSSHYHLENRALSIPAGNGCSV